MKYNIDEIVPRYKWDIIIDEELGRKSLGMRYSKYVTYYGNIIQVDPEKSNPYSLIKNGAIVRKGLVISTIRDERVQNERSKVPDIDMIYNRNLPYILDENTQNKVLEFTPKHEKKTIYVKWY